MKTNLSLLFLIFLIKLFECINPSCKNINSNALTLNTKNGKVKGSCFNVAINYASKPKSVNNPLLTWFKIPYAVAPTGVNRFLAPTPVNSWTNVLDATVMSKQCMQPSYASNSGSSEDCLYLNIYAPYNAYIQSVLNKNSTALLPIFVWIHGGAFSLGSGNEYDGSLISVMSNMIVVTINYRLGVFGFLSIANTNAFGNLALRDQNLALKWIYNNAASFGGDKSRITIGGESAGSWSVGYHLIYKDSWPYFNQAILQSGNPVQLDVDTLLISSVAMTSISYKFGASVGCSKQQASNNAALLSCLQKVNVNTLNAAANYFLTFPAFTLDSNVFNQVPLSLFQAGQFKKCKILTGSNSNEELGLVDTELSAQQMKNLQNGKLGELYVTLMQRLNVSVAIADQIIKFYVSPADLNPNNKANFLNYFNKIITDFQYRCPTSRLAEFYSNKNVSAYVYMYANKSPTNPQGDGAVHGDELEFTWAYPLDVANANYYSSADRLFTEKMVQYWANFIANKSPTSTWLLFSTAANSSNNRNVYFLKNGQSGNKVTQINEPACLLWANLNIVPVKRLTKI